MITDNERREVAQKLRWLPIDMYNTIDEWEKDGLFINNSVSDEGDYSQIHDAVFGCFPAEYMHPGDYEELHERLADLIDRPTCRNEEDSYDRTFLCSACGYEAYTYSDSNCNPHDFSYCPECGAVITDAKRQG